MSKTISFLFIVIFLGGLFFPLISLAVSSYQSNGETIYYEGLVPCGGIRTDPEGNPLNRQSIPHGGVSPGFVAISDTEMAKSTPSCTLCHFFVMIDGWIDGLLFMFVPITAALMIAIGGVMYIISQGNPEMLGRAKKLFTAVVIGLVIIYGAWLIVNLFLTVIGATVWQGPGQGWWIFPCS